MTNKFLLACYNAAKTDLCASYALSIKIGDIGKFAMARYIRRRRLSEKLYQRLMERI